MFCYLCNNDTVYFTRAALKVMSPIFLYWPTISEENVGGTAAEAECSHQYSITFCCHMTDGSRGAVWHGSAEEARVCNWILPRGKKNGTHWHSLTLAEHLTEAEHWVVCFSNGNSRSSPLVQMFTCLAYRLLFTAGKNPELTVVTTLKNSVL